MEFRRLIQATDVVAETFEWYLKGHQVNSTSKRPRYHLRCGDNFLRYLGPRKRDPRDRGDSGQTKYSLSKRKLSPNRRVAKADRASLSVVRS